MKKPINYLSNAHNKWVKFAPCGHYDLQKAVVSTTVSFFFFMTRVLPLTILLLLCESVYGQGLFEFEVGMYWEYSVTGKESYKVVNRITKSKIINGKRWFQLVEYGEKFWVANSPQGQVEAINLYETDAENIDDLGIELIFKYPAREGDTWVSSSTPTTYIGIKEITVPAGTFRCHMYHMELGSRDYSDTCIAEGVGVIYSEAVMNNGEKEISNLISYGK